MIHADADGAGRFILTSYSYRCVDVGSRALAASQDEMQGEREAGSGLSRCAVGAVMTG